jgi:hypothetical protein
VDFFVWYHFLRKQQVPPMKEDKTFKMTFEIIIKC